MMSEYDIYGRAVTSDQFKVMILSRIFIVNNLYIFWFYVVTIIVTCMESVCVFIKSIDLVTIEAKFVNKGIGNLAGINLIRSLRRAISIQLKAHHELS